MSKDAWRNFVRWLDSAGPHELTEKHAQCLRLLTSLTDAELASHLRKMIRLIEEEQVIALGIASRQRRHPKS